MATKIKEKKVKKITKTKIKVKGLQRQSIIPMTEEIERISDGLIGLLANKNIYFDDISILILIQTNGRKKNVKGHCYRYANWINKDGDNCHEIQISAEFLNDSAMEITSTILHELTHAYCRSKNIKDCANNGRHNKKFEAEATSFGMIVKKQGSHGFADTTLTPEMESEIAEIIQPNDKVFTLFRESTKTQTRKPTETKMKKWECGCTIVRCAVELDAICDKPACGNPFRKESTIDDLIKEIINVN